KLVGGEVGEIIKRLDVRLAERDQHRLGEMRHFGQIVGDSESAALVAARGFAALQRLGGAALELGGDVVVEALDRGDLLHGHVGDFLKAGEAFGDKQL